MNKKNKSYMENLRKSFIKSKIHCYYTDTDWDKKNNFNLLVSKKSYADFKSLIESKGFILFRKIGYWKHFFVKYSHEELIVLDVHIEKYETASKKVLNFNSEILSNEQLIYLMLYKSSYRNINRYLTRIKTLIKTKINQKMLIKYLACNFSNAEEIVNNLFSHKYSQIKLKRNFTYVLSSIFVIKRNALFKLFNLIKKLFSKPKYIVIMGSDGSGKTTLVENLSNLFSKSNISNRGSSGARFNFKCLPLNFLAKKSSKSKLLKKDVKGDVINYKSGFIKSIIPFVYYLEYLLRYIFLIEPLRFKYDYVFEDRYYLDLLVSKNANIKSVRFLYKLLPKPYKIIYLYNDMDTIIKRRTDHPKDDLIYQQSQFKKYQTLFNKKIKSSSIDYVLSHSIAEIFKK